MTAKSHYTLAFAAAVAVFADVAPAQDKRLEALCGNLYGARQTAIRLAQNGFNLQRIVQETVNRPEWRDASMPDKKLLTDLLEETFNDPGSPSSQVIRDCMRRAESGPPAQ